MSKLLLVGPLTNKHDATKTGGTTVLFELLLSELREKNIEFDVIDTLKYNYPNPILAYILIVMKIFFKIRQYDYVSIHATEYSLIFIAPIVVFLSKKFKKRVSVRKFAGRLHKIHLNTGYIKRSIIEYVLKNSDEIFFETKYLVDYFQKFNKRTYWFPNVRKKMDIKKSSGNFGQKFVFIGTINPEKGIDEICEAVSKLSKNYTIDLYGPIHNKKYSKQYFENLSVSYKGALLAEDVLKILADYDVLILPSYSEGYPGVIIEAFSLGMPVIATKLTGIMEMVEDQVNGLLIDTHSSDQLIDAIKSITSVNYSKLSREAKQSFTKFDSHVQTELFLNRIAIL